MHINWKSNYPHVTALLLHPHSITIVWAVYFSSGFNQTKPPPLSRFNMNKLLITLTALLLNACVQVGQYPASWGKTISSTLPDTCPSLEGIYKNKGENSNGTVAHLATWLPAPASSQKNEERLSPQQMRDILLGATTVTLDLANDMLLTVTASGNNMNRQWSYDKSKADFTCHNGVLSIVRGGDMSGDNVAAFGSGTIDLFQTEDHLTVNSHLFTAGVMLLIPVASYESNWARFAIQQADVPQRTPSSLSPPSK